METLFSTSVSVVRLTTLIPCENYKTQIFIFVFITWPLWRLFSGTRVGALSPNLCKTRILTVVTHSNMCGNHITDFYVTR
jgi:hypothetical protein